MPSHHYGEEDMRGEREKSWRLVSRRRGHFLKWGRNLGEEDRSQQGPEDKPFTL